MLSSTAVQIIAYAIHKSIDGAFPNGIYNVAEHNMTINEVNQVVQEIYPELETIHVNHNIKLRDVQTALPSKIHAFITMPNTALKEELMDFKNQFSF